MLKSFLVIFFAIIIQFAFGQQKYWQQNVNYTIDVKLNDIDNTLDGFETMEYINNSPDTLRYIMVHLWMNAYKNDKTAFSEQQLQNGNLGFYFSDEKDKGYINRLNFQANKTTLLVEDHPNYIDIVKVNLSEPLAPNNTIVITTPFHVKLPYNFSRGGHVNQAYQITQWFPKAALYDKNGWHEMPYLDQGEFFSDFGNYIVNITLPKNYKVAATGELQNEEEIKWLQEQSSITYTNIKATHKSTVNTNKKIFTPKIESSKEFKTITYKQNNVVDFAWFADKEYVVQSETIALPSGKKVLCQSFYYEKDKTVWKQSLEFMKTALVFRSKKIGEYPFNVATVVSAPMGFAGGMEYPTITSIAGKYNTQSLDMVIEHELGHNWFQGILASNERDHPWMDEGLNTYYDDRYEDEKYPTNSHGTEYLFRIIKLNTKPLKIITAIKKDQPINTTSQNFTSLNYNFIAYEKTGEWLKLLENTIGTASMDSAMQSYYSNWNFKHPSPNDFDNTFSQYKIYTDSLQQLRDKKGSLQLPKKKSNALITPLIGYNKYNSVMLGAAIHNYTAEQRNFRYLLLPLFAFKTKNLNGFVKLVYHKYYETGKIERVDIGLNASHFGQNDFKDERSDLQLGFTKLVPFVRVTLKEKSPQSPFIKTIQFKHFNITEDALDFEQVFNAPIDTFFKANKIKSNFYINQLQFNIKKTSALYPYNIQLQIEQNKDIVRTTFAADQFFNYNAKGEGLWVRLFAGKINYLKSKTNTVQYENDRFALNLLAPKGSEDYTYSTYFIGRNEFEKGLAKQILQRDGFFKFRTDLLASKPGRTDNWLASANFVTSIPSSINPLSVLPIKIPIKIFADLGTYAEAWEKNSTATKFLYNAGLQLSIAKGTVEIYLPLMYSKTFTDYSLQMWGKKRSIKNVSFSINLNNFTLRKFIPQINF